MNYKVVVGGGARWPCRVGRCSPEWKEDRGRKVGAVQSWRRKIVTLDEWGMQESSGREVELHG